MYDLAHGTLAQADRFGQFLAGIYRFFNRRKVWQCCRTFLGLAGAKILSASSHVGFGLGFNLGFQLQGNFAKLPLFQITASLLGIQCPLLGLQQILKRENGHRVRQIILFAQRLTVVPVDDDHVLIDDDGRVAAVFDEICFQSVELLRAQRRE